MEEKMDKNESTTVVAPVVTGSTKVKKKNWFQRTGELLFAQTDSSTVGQYLVRDILVPYFRKVIFDLVTSTVDMFLYGGSTPTNKAVPGRGSYVNYNAGYSNRQQPQLTQNNRGVVTGTDVFNFEKIYFDSKRDAMAVLDSMCEILSRYSLVTVSQFYQLANQDIDNVQATKFGWFDLSGADVVRDYSGTFFIKLPKPSPID
jgi:hypothetical protein